MCGGAYRGRRGAFGGRHGDVFGVEVGALGARGRVLAALLVLVPVGLSGLALAFTPVWWIFTTYFWVAFPAVGLLAGGLAELGRERSERAERSAPERLETALLWALRERGELTAAGAAAETPLGVAEAERMLRDLAEGGHLAVRVRGGAIFYALWEDEGVQEIEGREVGA